MIKLKKFLKCLCLDGINTLYITILDGPSKEDGATIFNLTFQANLFFREKEEILAKYGDFYVDKCYYGNRVGLEEGAGLDINIIVPDYVLELARAVTLS